MNEEQTAQDTLDSALPLLGFSPQIWGFRPDLGFWDFFLETYGFSWGFSKNLGFFWGFVRFPRKIHILECFLLDKSRFLEKSSIFSRKSSIFSRKSSIFPQNLYKFDLGFSGVFSVARLGFSSFF